MPASHNIIDSVQRQIAHDLNGPNDQELIRFDIVKELASGDNNEVTELLPAAQVPAGKKIFIDKIAVWSSGAAWTTGTKVEITSTGTTGTVFADIATAQLPDGTGFLILTDNSNADCSKGMAAGGDDGEGLEFVRTGNFAGAATLSVRITGCIRDADPDDGI